jgi:PD-(D/E)XK endonuclease
MKKNGASIKQRKQRGEWAELRFMARASEPGLLVSKSWGDTSRYDFVVEHAGKLMRVQVKSTTFRRNRSYVCTLCANEGKPYTIGQIDFVAAYIIPKNIWFIFPVEAILKRSHLTLSPHMKVSKNRRRAALVHSPNSSRSRLV